MSKLWVPRAEDGACRFPRFLGPQCQRVSPCPAQMYSPGRSSRERWGCFRPRAPGRKETAPSACHRHPPGFCKVHSFENKIAFYEAVPFLFPLSGRFAENNLNFMQLPLRGSAAPFPSHSRPGSGAQSWFCFSAPTPLPLGP